MAIAVIPQKNRMDVRDFDEVLYKDCNLIKCLFQKSKNDRRIATRYKCCVTHYSYLFSLVYSVIWLE